MKPAERQAWILERLEKPHQSTNVCDAYDVDAYIRHTGAPFDPMPYGSHRCPQFGRDLAALFKAGKVTRIVCGLGDMRSMGFPAWVYVYRGIRSA